MRDTHQIQAARDRVRVFDHETGEFPVELPVKIVHFVVARDDLPSHVGFLVHERVDPIADHSAADLGHVRDVHVRFQLWFLVQFLDSVGDVDGLVGDAL